MSNVNEWNLGELLNYCQDKKILTKPSCEFVGCHFAYDSVCVARGPFAAQCYSHDTGNTVRVYIVGAGEPFLMMNGTYWKRSGYDHNPFYRERGSWDGAFAEFVAAVQAAVEARIDMDEIKKAEKQEASLRQAAQRKAEVEALFKIGKDEVAG